VYVSRSRPRHVTSNRKLGGDFQSRSESPFGLAHDGVARANEGRSLALRVIRAAESPGYDTGREERREGEERRREGGGKSRRGACARG